MRRGRVPMVATCTPRSNSSAATWTASSALRRSASVNSQPSWTRRRRYVSTSRSRSSDWRNVWPTSAHSKWHSRSFPAAYQASPEDVPFPHCLSLTQVTVSPVAQKRLLFLTPFPLVLLLAAKWTGARFFVAFFLFPALSVFFLRKCDI